MPEKMKILGKPESTFFYDILHDLYIHVTHFTYNYNFMVENIIIRKSQFTKV